jgi:hypothetical protein
MNNMNNDLAKQMSLLSAAGRLRATSASGQQQAMRNGMVPPVPPNVPGDKQRAQFLAMLSQVLAQRGIALPPFVTGQPNPAYNPDSGPLKNVQPASDNRLGALRLPGAVPGRVGDIDLFKLWSAVTGAGGMQRVSFSFFLIVHSVNGHLDSSWWAMGCCCESYWVPAIAPSSRTTSPTILHCACATRGSHEGMPCAIWSFPSANSRGSALHKQNKRRCLLSSSSNNSNSSNSSNSKT